MNNKLLILIFLFFFIFHLNINSQENNENIILLKGSNIYARIFLFFFPISDKYESFFIFLKDSYNIELSVKKESIKNEPSTPPYFESDLIFHIRNIPYNESGIFKLPLIIQCNKKFINKDVNFTLFRKGHLLIIKGALNDLYINEITDNEYFEKRSKWKFPIHFDIRLYIKE
jgi:hypothetical protein